MIHEYQFSIDSIDAANKATLRPTSPSTANARFFLSPRPQRDFTAWVEPTALQ